MKIIKLGFGLCLIVILVGYNYIINLPQALQTQIIQLHELHVSKFNLLYSLQTLPTLFLIIPAGVLYDRVGPSLLILAAFIIAFGQFFMFIFTSIKSTISFPLMVFGRILQGVGAEVLYLGQGSLATRWMGNMVGLIVVLPQVGQIANVFLTPLAYNTGGLRLAMGIGLILCVVSLIASLGLFAMERKFEKSMELQKQQKEQVRCESCKSYTKLFWMLIVICAIDESIYIPFMDNANELLQIRFGIKYEDTGKFLCLPFISAMVSTVVFGLMLQKYHKKRMVIISGLLGIISHCFIYLLPNSSTLNHFSIALGFMLMGLGLGSYYAVIYPLVGLSVEKQYRGTAYAIVAFVQAAGMSVIPQISGLIIQNNSILSVGYKNSSLLFSGLGLIGLGFCIVVVRIEHEVLDTIGAIEEYDELKTGIEMEESQKTHKQNMSNKDIIKQESSFNSMPIQL